jgi:hypothetical protein
MRFIINICLLLASSTASWTLATERKVDLMSQLHSNKVFNVLPNKKLSLNYENTECVNLLLKNKKQVIGFICHSKDANLLKEMGIRRFDLMPERSRSIDRPESGFVVNTSNSQYPLKKFGFENAQRYDAIVDCDEGSLPVTRPTSTCHIAMSNTNDLNFFYSNFVLKNHVTHSNGVSVKQIKALWETLEFKH